MAKRPGSLVLTFSKKNSDVRKLLENKKSKDENFIVTQYICDSIRFYEKYKDSTEFNDLAAVKKLIDDRLKEFMRINSTATFALEQYENNLEKKVSINELKIDTSNLENDLDDIPIDED